MELLFFFLYEYVYTLEYLTYTQNKTGRVIFYCSSTSISIGLGLRKGALATKIKLDKLVRSETSLKIIYLYIFISSARFLTALFDFNQNYIDSCQRCSEEKTYNEIRLLGARHYGPKYSLNPILILIEVIRQKVIMLAESKVNNIKEKKFISSERDSVIFN